MKTYRCTNCGYEGEELIYTLSDYTYCVASNEEEPEYRGSIPQWALEKVLGEAEIGEPVGCPQCHAWGVGNFEVTI